MLNEKIKKLRLSFKVSQVGLAHSLGVSKQCVSNWENDNVQPSVEMLVKLAKYFNVTTDYLLDLDDGQFINVEGLSDKALAHVKMIVEDLRICSGK